MKRDIARILLVLCVFACSPAPTAPPIPTPADAADGADLPAPDPDGGAAEMSPPPDAAACPCLIGERRCAGSGVQACEATSGTCGGWGPTTACGSGSCTNGSCGQSCTDKCPGGTSRCMGDGSRDVCRVGPSGCFEWTSEACVVGGFCEAGQCHAPIPCAPACPMGYGCDPRGVCTGALPPNLNLDVKLHRVSGAVTINGAPPAATCTDGGTRDKARVLFHDKARASTLYAESSCISAGVTFQIGLPPGTYDVSIDRGSSFALKELSPADGGRVVLKEGLVVAADIAGLAYDITTHAVSGTVKISGATPTDNCSSMDFLYDKAQLSFLDTTNHRGFVTGVRCGGTGVSFAAQLPPGTYQVSIGPGQLRTLNQLPRLELGRVLVKDALVVAGPLSNQMLDVKLHQVSGAVTINGAPPAATCTDGGTRDKARVLFHDKARASTLYAESSCISAGITFQIGLPPGTYDVSIDRGSSFALKELSPADGGRVVLKEGLVVAADITGLAYDITTHPVSGTVKISGATPTDNCSSMDFLYDKAQLSFLDMTNHRGFVTGVRCGGTGVSFAAQLPPGTYQVSIGPGQLRTLNQLPRLELGRVLVKDALVVAGPLSGQMLDVKLHQVSGAVTINGAPPAATCTDGGTRDKARVLFHDKARASTLYAESSCISAGITFQIGLPPGTYDVSIDRGSYFALKELSPADGGRVVLKEGLVVAADITGLAYDITTHPVSGTVKISGATPTDNCSSMDFLYDKAQLSFLDTTNRRGFVTGVRCGGAGVYFVAQLPPGTYQVSIGPGQLRTLNQLPHLELGRVLVQTAIRF